MIIKILSTIGPTTCEKKNLAKLLNYGDILRTNASHNSIKWHENISQLIKSINPNAIHLFDIPGVKPRTKNKKKILIKKNEKIFFYYKNITNIKSKLKKIELSKSLPRFKTIPKKFSVSDGQFFFDLLDFNNNFVIGKSNSDFALLPHKGLNIPGSIYDDELQLIHYKNFLKKSKSVKYDAIGLSFIQSRKVIDSIKKIYNDKIILSKIENLYSLKNIKEIVEASDAIMIDRGDLSAEVGSHNLFSSVLEISEETKKQGKPLIMATENLDSMMNRNQPTKSEIISLEFNFLLGSDYIMLSDETATSDNWENTLKWLYDYQYKSKPLKINFNQKLEKNNKNTHINENINTDIWSSINFNTTNPFVFISRSGASIKEFKKKYRLNKCFVFTDSIKTRNLCKFWKDVTPFYCKSLGGFNRGKDVLKMIKKNEKIIFAGKKNKVICILILNPRKNSKANTVYFIDKKDLKQLNK